MDLDKLKLLIEEQAKRQAKNTALTKLLFGPCMVLFGFALNKETEIHIYALTKIHEPKEQP